MFEITLEPNRLKSMLTQVLKLKSGSSPVDAVPIKFTSEGAEVKTAYSTDLMVFARYNKDFFKSIKVDGEDEFMANVELIKKRINFGFTGESITLKTDNEKVIITGQQKDDKVTQKLDAISHEKDAPFDVEETRIGLIPKKGDKQMSFAFSILVPVESFTDDLPDEVATLIVDENKNFSLNFEDETGTRSRPITYKSTNITQEMIQPTKIIFSYKTFRELCSMFKGEVWLSGDESKLIISQTNTDFSLTYAHAPMKEA